FLTEYDEDAHLRNTYAEGIEEGIEKGIEKGIEVGMEKGIEKGSIKKSKENILKVLEKKGTVTEECQKAILAQKDGKILDEWFKKALDAVSVEEFMEQIE
ncbi:MAG: hypothetical protein NC086_06410, partial [Alistipes sp.]|nr:hypothetical protein [Alistipes sp.]